MKRMLLIALCFYMTFSFAGCANENSPTASGTENNTSAIEETNNDSNSPEQNGIWVTKSYVDEFGDSTYRKYITTEVLLSGTFSNTQQQIQN